MVFNKKGISPVVATALLLVVAVVAVVGFQTWFYTYQSGLQVKTEQQSNAGTAITIERLGTDSLYLKNAGTSEINVNSITVGSDTSCNNSFNLPASSVTNVYVNASCSFNETTGTEVDVVVITNGGIYQETELVR